MTMLLEEGKIQFPQKQFHMVIQGDVTASLKRLPSESVDCVVTSPLGRLINTNTISGGVRVRDIAYMAGLIDGEAYIGIKKDLTSVRSGHSRSPLYHERIQIRMVDEVAIKFVADQLGGNYYLETKNHGRLPLFCFQATDSKAYNIIRTVYPYLKVKRKVAELIFKLRESKEDPEAAKRGNRGGRRKGKGQAMAQSILDHRESLYIEAKRLNPKGKLRREVIQ